jgi:DHA1 family bicyclomycin/chloramphenicol resistance-like MFS transporter
MVTGRAGHAAGGSWSARPDRDLTRPADPTLRDPSIPAPALWLVAGMPSLGIFASLVYMPSLEAMAVDFASGVEAIQHTVTIYLGAMASFALVAGPLSDRYGRRSIAMLSLAIFAAGSLLALGSPSIGWLMIARFLQGMGAAGGIVLPRSMVRDALHDLHAARASATIAMSISVVPMLTPLVGGYVQDLAGWRANFVLVAALALALCLLAWRHLHETLPPARRFTDGARAMLRGYLSLFANRQFMVHTLPVACGAVAIFSYQTEAPVLLIAELGVPPTEYGYYAAMPAMGFFMGTSITRRFALTISRGRLIEAGCCLYVLAGLAMALLAVAFGPGPWLIALPMVAFGAGNGLVMPNASIGGVSAAPMLVGCASALSSCMRMGSGSIGSTLVTYLPAGSAGSLGVLVALTGTAALACWFALGRGEG